MPCGPHHPANPSRRTATDSPTREYASSPPSRSSQGRVRDPILASWRRSRESNVAADRIKMPYVHDPNLDTPLSRSAYRCCGS
jgi:hypothetical protein